MKQYLAYVILLLFVGCIAEYLPATQGYVNKVAKQLNGNTKELRDDVQEKQQEVKNVLKDVAELTYKQAKYDNKLAKKSKNDGNIRVTEKIVLDSYVTAKKAVEISRTKLNEVDDFKSPSDWIDAILGSIMDNPAIAAIITMLTGGTGMSILKTMRLAKENQHEREEKENERKRRKNIQRRHRKVVGRTRKLEGKHGEQILDDDEDDYDLDD